MRPDSAAKHGKDWTFFERMRFRPRCTLMKNGMERSANQVGSGFESQHSYRSRITERAFAVHVDADQGLGGGVEQQTNPRFSFDQFVLNFLQVCHVAGDGGSTNERTVSVAD